MKGIQVSAYGGSEVLEYKADLPEPKPLEQGTRVQVKAASINPFDVKLIAGAMKEMIPLTFPFTVGGNFSGVTDDGVEVYGNALVLTGGSGAFAEITLAKNSTIAPKPKRANFLEAAALPLVGVSAVQALVEHIHLRPNQTILIHGGAGGIGHLAVQLVKSLGAIVYTTVRTKDMDFAKSLGADTVIDYTKEAFETKITDVDAVFDTVGGEVTTKSFSVLKRGGILVSMVGKPDEELAQKSGVIAIGQQSKTDTVHLTQVADLYDQKKFTVHIDKVFPLSQAKDAWEAQISGHPQGKVVIELGVR